ncbi:HAMP domain-containing sensor histidine kinase [Paenibacillus sp. FSL M8-0228]|uniref:sensor histidine kinase n=1 Tax=Paenibacillus TaxID=44249 RepID=UPI00083CF0BE|nr:MULTISPECIES: HAMP domain-containing sensor histidine kinase [Paenibacillus]MBO3283900.1 HAMP domain-containing histidine kinase [Paenibacillus polymyxa]MBP1311064.1 K+-sensing histidine kinase KdpD [Paenibacillus sp. 1182]ODB50561.1 two-component sensor histidine kinase [Paenibacillus polymyxa]
MNSLVKMSFRFMKVTLCFVLAYVLCFVICTILYIFIKSIFGASQNININLFWTGLGIVQSAVFIAAYGWYIGKPLVYVIKWIGNIATGEFQAPLTELELPERKKNQKNSYKPPYQLYKEVFEQMNILSAQLRSNEEERMEIEKRKQQWVAGVSHDLKTPLSYIEGYAAMLTAQEYDWSDEERRSFSMSISEKVTEMKQLIQDLNASMQLNESPLPVQLEKEDIVEFLRSAVIDIANHPSAEQYEFSFTSMEATCIMSFDSKLLGRALQNFLINAIIHNPPGTHVSMEVSKANDKLHISIEDDGIGMNSNEYMQVSHSQGHGIPIAKSFIEAHNGTLRILPGSKAGTRMEISLPLNI